MTVTYADLTLDWFGYATLRIESAEGIVAYLDPGRYGVLTGSGRPAIPTRLGPEPVERIVLAGWSLSHPLVALVEVVLIFLVLRTTP